MRVEILANDRASFIKPMAEGLAECWPRSEPMRGFTTTDSRKLMLRQSFEFSSPRAIAGSALRLRRDRREFDQFAESLRGADVIVVVANVPGSFARALLPNIELLRSRFPNVPIVNYDLHYLPTLYSWGRQILKGESTLLHADHTGVLRQGHWGLERYDWYLMASVGTEVPLTREPHPYSLIGLDLDDGSLYPDQKGRFRALVDFSQDRLHYPEFRKIQIEALRLCGSRLRRARGIIHDGRDPEDLSGELDLLSCIGGGVRSSDLRASGVRGQSISSRSALGSIALAGQGLFHRA